MKLIVIGSSSAGNCYALDSGKDILLLEAGIRHSLMTKAIGFRDDQVIACCVSHVHLDHAKYLEEYSKRGTHVFCNDDVADKKKMMFGGYEVLQPFKTIKAGLFDIAAVPLHHSNNDGSDCPNYGYIIKHPDMGILFFGSDTYKYNTYFTNIDHWLIEANYDDRLLKANVQDGKIDRAQANRLMLSHMSLDNTVHYLHECQAENSQTIILCHLSERNSDPDMFRKRVAGEFGVPVYVAQKGLVVELNKNII